MSLPVDQPGILGETEDRFSLYGPGGPFPIMAKPIDVTDATFESEVLKSPVPVLLDFWAPWCGPCRAIAPALEELTGQYEGKAKIAKINIDENMNTPSQFGVRAIPTLIVFKGGKAVDQIMGAQPKASIATVLNKHI